MRYYAARRFLLAFSGNHRQNDEYDDAGSKPQDTQGIDHGI